MPQPRGWGPLLANEGLAFSFGEDVNTEKNTYDCRSSVWSILNVLNFSSPSCSQRSTWLLHEEKSCQLHRPTPAQHLGTSPLLGAPLWTVSAQSRSQPLLLPALSASPPRIYRFWDPLQTTFTQSLCLSPTSLRPLFLADSSSLPLSGFVWQFRRPQHIRRDTQTCRPSTPTVSCSPWATTRD